MGVPQASDGPASMSTAHAIHPETPDNIDMHGVLFVSGLTEVMTPRRSGW